MDKAYKKTIRELMKCENLEVNLSKYANDLASMYYNCAFLDLAMEYCICIESMAECKYVDTEALSAYLQVIKDIINNNIYLQFDGEKREENILKLSEIRDKVSNRINKEFMCMDCLSIYEKTLLKLDYRYNEEFQYADESDEELAEEVLDYIFEREELHVIIARFKEVVPKLPVRMTKIKYFDILTQSFLKYTNANKNNFDEYVERIREGIVFNLDGTTDKCFDNIVDLIKELQEIDYKNLEKKEYKELLEKIDTSISYLDDDIGIFLKLQDSINNLYTIILMEPYAMDKNEDSITICKEIIDAINKNAEAGVEIVDDNVDNMFEETEGRHEELDDCLIIVEAMLDDILKKHKDMLDSLMLMPQYNCLKKAYLLMSTSSFAKLDKVVTEESADRDYINKVADNFIKEIDALFSKNNVLVNRQIMASSFENLIISFNSFEEIREFVINSFKMCKNKGEKTFCIEAVRRLKNIY